MITVLSAFGMWTLGAASGGVVGNLSYDGVKKLNKSFKERFKKYYKSEEEAEVHLELMSTAQSTNPKKPFRDVEDTFEDIMSTELPKGFIEEFKEWILENQEVLLNSVQNNSNSFNIGSQSAQGDINNVNGTQIVNRGTTGVRNE
ncbi:hypothetical protein [Priestia sp. JSM ZJ58]|uniref:hypothetical protein n=1 Tax=Priestia sp. JSM ZJ58 TaxID=3376189 RepID=UPI0037ABB1EC